MRISKLIMVSFLFLRSLFGQTTGRVELHSLFSPALGISKNFNIYLPPGYDSSTGRYPVVYFLRGHEREWFNEKEDDTRNGVTLKTIADSLIRSHAIGNMILVGPSMSSSDNTIPGLGVDMLSPDTTAGIGSGKFEQYFTHDLIQHIDSAYRTIPDREHRGIDGFSLGGYMSVMMGIKHPELFSSVGCYDGTHMWDNLDDPRVSGTPPDDATWISGNYFDQDFGSSRNTKYMLRYNAVNILHNADSTKLNLIRSVNFHIQSAAFDGQQGNIDRGRHIVNELKLKNIENSFEDIRLTPNALHNWHFANLHAEQTLVKHWQTFGRTK